MRDIESLLNEEKVKIFFKKYKIDFNKKNVLLFFEEINIYLDEIEHDCNKTEICLRDPWGIKHFFNFTNGNLYCKEGFCEHYYKRYPYEKIKKYIIFDDNNLSDFKYELADIKTGNNKELVHILTYFSKVISGKSTKGIYISGNPGCGKTFLYKCLAKEFAKKEKTVIMTTMPTLLNKLKTNFNEKFYKSDLTISMCQKVDVLILDDIGIEKVSNWSRDEVLYLILDYRLNHKKITFFASNLTLLEGLYKVYQKVNIAGGVLSLNDQLGSARIVDRIKGLCGENIHLKNGSKR